MPPKEMKAIVNTAPGKLKLLSHIIPRPGPGWVRIATRAVGICSTDLRMITGWQRTGYPSVPGHEWCGIIDATGAGVNPAISGRLCVADNIIAGGEVGFEFPGGFAEYFLTRADNLYLLPDEFPPQQAVLIEPLAVCLHALERVDFSREQSVLIFGDGPIGLLLLAVLRQRGVKTVWLVGGQPNRMAMALEIGAEAVLDFHTTSPQQILASKELPAPTFPLIIEASGSETALNWAFDLAPQRGTILVLGDYGSSRAEYFWNDLLHRELLIAGSNASAGAWLPAVRLALSGSLPLGKLVTHRFAYTQFNEAVEMAGKHKDQCIKVVIDWSRAH